jgi:hypothetical protein
VGQTPDKKTGLSMMNMKKMDRKGGSSKGVGVAKS